MLKLHHLTYLIALAAVDCVTDPAPCGGVLRGPHGLIQTPNFPDPFPVPVRCKWVIENPKLNGTISVYFTQQFTTSGLSFTEYLYYDESYRAGERKALTVTDDNITRVKYLQVTSPFLVVELSLDRLEGTQLRALGLLDLFGFNITYEVRPPSRHDVSMPRTGACSAIECRLLGHCYARKDFKSFFCDCFEGYSGADCGTGPLCPTTDTCKNGGTCRQLGPAAVSCLCAPGYTGDLCETLMAPPECGIEECSEGCRNYNNCDCNPRDNDANSARFDTKLQILDTAELNITTDLLQQITTYLRNSNITLEEDVEIINISAPEVTVSSEGKPTRAVSVRVWGLRREAAGLRAALARLAATRGRLDRFRLLPVPLQFDMQPALTLASLTSTSRHEVWEGSEFMLSCMAYGSPATRFSWYKDGVKIQFNRTERDIWTRTVAEDALGRRLAVLGVGAAGLPDSGAWACAAGDGGRRRCRAVRLAVLRPPRIRLIPPTLTLNKGDNASITCLAGASGRVHGALGFSWARERTLLALAPGREEWEDLHPAGSLLKLYHVQKSGEYRCQVSSVAGTAAQAVRVWVAGAGERCAAGSAHGLRWAAAALGTRAWADCPGGYRGHATRYCETKTSSHGVRWATPDFSDCLADSLSDIYDQFIRVSYGYSTTPVASIAQQYGGALRALPSLPGAGARPLRHLAHLLAYLQSPICDARERGVAVKPVLRIFDVLLAHQDTFLDEQKIFELQSTLVNVASLSDSTEASLRHLTLQTLAVRDQRDLRFRFPAVNTSQPWSLVELSVELPERSSVNATLLAVVYHSLEDNLPSLRRTTEFRTDGQLQYGLVSQHVQLAAAGALTDPSGLGPHPAVVLVFRNSHNHTVPGSKFACGLRPASDPGTWDTRACEPRVLDRGQILCKCPSLGSYGLLYLDKSLSSTSDTRTRPVVVAALVTGALLCAVAALLQLPLLVHRLRLPTLLRTVFCISQAAAMGSLLQCYSQSEGWAWAVVVCWCVCGATLAAQPLLVQAELAGRTHVHLSSVALLTGVCIMTWLIARLSPGTPLQLGSSCQIVCSGSSALLALLCFGLSVNALIRLRAVSNKIPSDRRSFVRNRVVLVRRILLLLVCSGCTQIAGVLYVQPGETHVALVAVLAAAALATGLAATLCYALRGTRCRRLRQLGPLDCSDWEDSDTGNTSLSLFIKHGQEAESRGGASLASPPPAPAAAAASYWRAPTPDSPRAHRRPSSPDSRADIVRCVEFKDTQPGPSPRRLVTPARSVCDLIPGNPVPLQSDYMARICVENSNHVSPQPVLTCSIDFEPYSKDTYTISQDNCQICVKSNPDVSKILPPIKSCLKKPKSDMPSSLSLPSIEVDLIEEKKFKNDISLVNREWNRTYDSQKPADVLNKISDDLDFLLNRTQDCKGIGLENIQEET